MTHSLEKDRKYLGWYNRRGIAKVITRDYHWFKEQYLPAVERLEKAGMEKDRPLLSWCWYMIGDIYDFTESPIAAIRAYQKSFKIKPYSDALREIGNMYEKIGSYKKTAIFLKKAIRIDPEDKSAIHDLQWISTGGPSLYDKNDQCWKAGESLAQDKPALALKILAKSRSIKAMQVRACAFGILNDTDAVLGQWQKIAEAKEKIITTYADWFYMTDAVWNNVVFWKTIAYCARQKRIYSGIWWVPKGFNDTVAVTPVRGKDNSKAGIEHRNKHIYILAQYQIARINRDPKLAGQLSKKYPKWKEIKTLYKKLS